MTLTLELPPELETKLYEAAARSGQAPETFATAALADTLRGRVRRAKPAGATALPRNGEPGMSGESGMSGEPGMTTEPQMTWEEFEAAVDELAATSEPLPVLAPQATTRAGIYGDHD